MTSKLTTATRLLSEASIHADEAGRSLRLAKAAGRRVDAARRVFNDALEAEAAARRVMEDEYVMRHDLHVAEDGCLLCGPRAYSLHSTEATEGERYWAATFSADSALALGVTL